MSIKTYHYVIRGRVQGVAFRYYTVRAAMQYALRGTVKNLPNRDVEVYAQGDPEQIKHFESFLETGPPSARVERVIRRETSLEEAFPDFEIIY